MNAMAQAGMQVFAQAKAQPGKAAKTVQKKATQAAKTARKTVRWALCCASSGLPSPVIQCHVCMCHAKESGVLVLTRALQGGLGKAIPI